MDPRSLPAAPARPPAAVAEPDQPDDPVPPRTVFRWAAAGTLGVLVVLFGALAVYLLRNLLVQIVIAVFIAVSLDPAVRWLIQHRVRRPYAVLVIAVSALLLTAGLLWAVIPPLVTQAGGLTTDFPGYLDRLRESSPTLQRLEDGLGIRERVDALARDLPERVASQAVAFARRFFGALLSLLLVVVMTIYLMLDLPRLRRSLVRLFPRRHRPQVSDVVNLVVDKVGSYMIGNLVISLIAGATAFLALTMLKVPFALPLAVLVAVTDLIPLIGATIGAVICVIVAAATGNLWPQAVLLTTFFVVYQQLENYLVAPRVLRDSVDISAIAVLFAALVGASVLGIVGALMAIPVAAALRVIVGDRIRARDEAEEEAQARADAAAVVAAR
ncbi:MAG TPA: AI-2E family transporter [Micromonosporaceae bacterium]|nr:AI-2E family transporter [Micromonosporaceae bacterium]